MPSVECFNFHAIAEKITHSFIRHSRWQKAPVAASVVVWAATEARAAVAENKPITLWRPAILKDFAGDRFPDHKESPGVQVCRYNNWHPVAGRHDLPQAVLRFLLSS